MLRADPDRTVASTILAGGLTAALLIGGADGWGPPQRGGSDPFGAKGGQRERRRDRLDARGAAPGYGSAPPDPAAPREGDLNTP